MTKKKLNFSKLIFEFISISFAVLIALFVNQWREDYNNDKLGEKAVYNIQEELKENKGIMVQLVPYHKSVLSDIDSLIIISEKDKINTDKINSIELTLISSSAWEMAKMTKAIFYMDFDDVNNLAKVYNLQTYYESIVKQYILKNSYNYHDDQDVESAKSTKQFLETIIPLEENLEYYYDIMLNEVLTEGTKN